MYDWPPEFWDNKNGAALLPAILESHRPLDLVIVALCGNDLVPWVGKSAAEATEGMRHIINLIRSAPPGGETLPIPILMVGPYDVSPTVRLGDEAATARFREQAALLSDAYRALAADLGVTFFEARGLVAVDPAGDGLHLNAENTRALGRAMVPVVTGLLEQEAA
jgi:lysophospholipase L1-like esterase